MKKFQKISIYMVLVAVVLFITSCIKMPDDPEIDIAGTIPVGYDKYTLEDLKNLPLPCTFDSAVSVYATVTMDEVNGNIYKQLYVQDSTGGMRLTFTESTGFVVGDSMRIYLKGKMLINNNGTYEIQTLQPDSNIVVLANKRYITPQEVTIDQINTRKYDLMLVKVVDVEFSDIDLGTTWADTTLTSSAVNHTLQDCNGQSILVRTSSYASFAGQKIPSGNGSMVAIVGVYGATMQLWTRTLAETQMNLTRCDGSGGNMQTIFTESFATGQGEFSTYSVLGAQEWTPNPSFRCMAMSGFVSGANKENEDWLISPEIDFIGSVLGTMSFEHTISKGSSNVVTPEYMITHQTLWISDDYENENPNNATWEQLEYTGLPSGTNWTYVTAKASIPEKYLGKKVRIAFKYTCDNNDSVSWQVRNVIIRTELPL